MKIGLFFGSFNPIHTGHLVICNHILNETPIQKIWFIVSPQNPFKTNSSLLDEKARLLLVRTAVKNDKRLEASNIEFGLPKPSFTINTLHFLAKKHPKHQFSIIMGSDNFQELSKWRDYKEIIRDYKIWVYTRTGAKIQNKIKADIEVLDAPLLDLSASGIRELVKRGKSIRYLVPETVQKMIERKGYYKK